MNQVDVVARHAARRVPRGAALAARMAAWQPQGSALADAARRQAERAAAAAGGPPPPIVGVALGVQARYALPAEVRAAIAASSVQSEAFASVPEWRLPTGPARPQWSPTRSDQLDFVPTQRTGAGASVPGARPARRGPRTTLLAWFALASAFLGLAPLGVVLGHLTLARVRRTGQAGRDQAIVALVLGYLAMVAAVLWFAFAVAPGVLGPML